MTIAELEGMGTCELIHIPGKVFGAIARLKRPMTPVSRSGNILPGRRYSHSTHNVICHARAARHNRRANLLRLKRLAKDSPESNVRAKADAELATTRTTLRSWVALKTNAEACGMGLPYPARVLAAPPLAQCALLYDDHWNEHVLKRTVLGGDSGDEGPSSDDDDDDGPDAAVGAEAKGVTRRTSSSTRPSRRSAPTRPLHQPRLSPPLSGPRTR